MTTPPRIFRLLATVAAMTMSLVARAQPSPPTVQGPPGLLAEVGIDQKLGGEVPLDVTLTDSMGRTVQLEQYFGESPVLLTLVYYECPSLCSLVLNSVLKSLNVLSQKVGEDFQIVTVSIDPTETAGLAHRKRENYLARYRGDAADQGWHFLVGDEPEIRRLADAVGFRYARDESTGQYAHAAGIMVLTPDGRVSRYLLGVEFLPRDMKLALLEASDGKLGSLVDAALLYCFNYDPSQGKYSLAILNVLRLGGGLTVVLLGGFVAIALVRERRRSHPEQETGDG